MNESSPSGSLLPPGTKVRIKPTTIGKSLGIRPRTRQGGEAVVSKGSIDEKGREIYTVTITKNGRSRVVHRSDLVVHRKQTRRG